MKRLLILIVFIQVVMTLNAQLTYGVTGLLHSPSAEMEKRGTFMVGGSFLNKELTTNHWEYHTYNYYINCTLLPWLEISFTETMLKVNSYKGYGPTNQDRYFSARIRLVSEGKYFKWMPSVVIGANDPYTSVGNGKVANESGNGYNNRFFLAASKHFVWKNQNFGVHLSYLYNRRKDYPLNGPGLGLTYEPSILPSLRVMAEYDSKDMALGAQYLFFNHLLLTIDMQRLQYFSGGLTYKVYLY